MDESHSPISAGRWPREQILRRGTVCEKKRIEISPQNYGEASLPVAAANTKLITRSKEAQESPDELVTIIGIFSNHDAVK